MAIGAAVGLTALILMLCSATGDGAALANAQPSSPGAPHAPGPAGARLDLSPASDTAARRPAARPLAADLSIVKTVQTDSDPASGATVSNGERITYTITVENITGASIDILKVTDNLPPGTLFDVQCVTDPPASPGTNCGLDVEEVPISIPSSGKGSAGQQFVLRVTKAVTWGGFSIDAGQVATLQFTAKVDCQPGGAAIDNMASVVFGIDGSVLPSNNVETTVVLKSVALQNDVGRPLIVGPSGCSAEPGGYDQDWGDFDRDGDLDLALGTSSQTSVYRNDGGKLTPLASHQHRTFGLRWGDVDGDGDLELISVGDYFTTTSGFRRGINYIYDNGDFSTPAKTFTTTDVLWRIDLADYDGDGQLDLAGASFFDPTARQKHNLCLVRVYDNDGSGNFTADECLIGPLTKDTIWYPVGTESSYSVAWGDSDFDGDSDLAVGDYGAYNRLHENENHKLGDFSLPLGDTSSPPEHTTSLTWGDYDNDGDLDLAWGNDDEPNVLYRQTGGAFESTPIWRGDKSDATHSVVWGNRATPNRDASIPAQDDDDLEYTLPFTFPFFGRDIVKINVNTNGLVELLEAGETCQECSRWNTHLWWCYGWGTRMDAIFAANDDLMTGVIIESLPEDNPNRVEITWLGSTYYDPDFTQKPMSFKVIMFDDGRVKWKFFDMEYPTGRHVFSGVYDEAADKEYTIGGYSGPPCQPGGTSPQGANVRKAYLFNGSGISEVAWTDGNPASIPTTDNANLVYSLPFPFPYFTRTIASLSINTNGLVELLETGESCQECTDPNTHADGDHVTKGIDALFAFNDDLKTGVMVEYVTNTAIITQNDHIAITWMGTTNADNNFLFWEMAYKVRLFRDGRVRWKFFDLNYSGFSGDRFSGLYDAVGPTQLEIPGGSTAFQGRRVYRKFEFLPRPVPTITVFSPQRLILAVGNEGQNYLYEPDGAGLTASPVWTSTDTLNTTSLVWVDYDSDNDLDLMAGNYGQEDKVYRVTTGPLPDTTPVNVVTETNNTRSVAWADWDKDGDPDLAVGNDNQPDRVYRNDGSGALSLAWSSVATDSTRSVAWADVDDDGFPDLATGSYDAYVKLYRNEGGTLGQTPIWTSLHISNTRSIAWGDVDGDGDPDLAVGNDGYRNALYQNRRYFLVGSERRELGWINDLAWGDYDNDGYPDLAIGGVDLEFPGGGFVHIVRNTGRKLVFANHTDIELDQGVPSELYDLAWGDYNRDGYLDLAAAFPAAQQVRIYKNPGGSGSWTLAQTLDGVTAYALDWADVQSDGWLDLAVADSPSNAAPELKIYLNQASSSGTDNFSAGAVVQPEADLITGTITSLRAIDRDNDGDLDLSAVNLGRQSQQFTVYGSFLNPVLTADDRVGSGPFKASNVAWGDYDGDGLLDLLYGGGNGGPAPDSTRLYHNTGSGFDLAGSSSGGQPTFDVGGRRFAIFGDYDGDGQLDIADGVPGGQVNLYPNNSSVQTINDVEAYNLGWGDADGDGFLDLLVAGKLSAARQNHVYINQGVSPFLDASASRWSSPQTERTVSVAWADYDDDNHLDFAVGNCNQDQSASVQLYHNNGDTTFSLVSGSGLPAAGYCTRSVAWADYDGDGDPDLAIGNEGQPNFIYQNQGGTFTPAWTSPVSATTYSVAWGDWDSDGRPDLAVGNYGERDRVYANLSTPDTTQLLWLWESAEAYQTTGLAWGDRDGDGDLDLAFSQDDPAQWNGVYENGYVSPAHLGNTGDMPLLRNPSYVSIHRPGSDDAYFISAGVLSGPTILITYTVFDPDGPRNATNPRGDDIIVAQTRYEYSVNGGDTWRPATILPAASSLAGTAAAPSVAINEVAWSGTLANAADEWIELKNNTAMAVALDGWTLAADDGEPSIVLSGVIPSNGYFLLERDDDNTVGEVTADQIYIGALSNSGETLRLLDFQSNVVDTANADGGPWPAGTDSVGSPAYASMERTDPAAADADDNWHTNDGLTRNGLDVGGNPINGTPKAANSVFTSTGVYDGRTLRQGVPVTVTWDAGADGVVSDYVLFRVTIVHRKPGGPVQHATTRAVSPPFRVRALTCQWPAGASITTSVNDVVTSTVAASQTIKFSAGLGTGTGVMTFTWDAGDGTDTATGQWVNHVYTTTGVYTVTLTVVGEPCPTVRRAVATTVVTVGPPLGTLPYAAYLPLVMKSAVTGTTTAAIIPAPGQVTGLRGSARGGQTTLVWTLNPPAEAVVGYRVYRGPRPGTGAFALIGTVAADVATYTDATAGCGYVYYVTAINTGGESQPSTSSYVSRPCR